MRRRQAGLVLLVIIAAIFIGAVTVPIYLDTDRFRARAIAYLSERTGKPVEMGKLTITFFPSVSIHVENLGVKSPPPYPPSDIIKVARIDARIDPWALLRRQIAIISLRLQEPTINLVSDPDGPWNFEHPGVVNTPTSLVIGTMHRVRIQHGRIIASNLLASHAPGPVFFEATDVSADLEDVDGAAIANPASASFAGRGALKAMTLRFGQLEAANFSSTVRLHARRVSFTDFTADVYGGTATGEFSIKSSGKRTMFEASAHLEKVDMEGLLSSFAYARGKITGRMEGDLKLAGPISHSIKPLDQLQGNGHVTIRDGQVPSLRLNENLTKLVKYNNLGPAKNDPSSFKSIATDLELNHDQIASKAIDIDGYGVDLDGSGTVSLTGSDELNYQGVAAITTQQGAMTNLFARLAGGTLKDGKLTFPFHVSGSLNNPTFTKGP